MKQFEHYVSPLDAAQVSTHLRHSNANSLTHHMSHSDLVLSLLLIQLLDIRKGLSNIIIYYQICRGIAGSYQIVNYNILPSQDVIVMFFLLVICFLLMHRLFHTIV